VRRKFCARTFTIEITPSSRLDYFRLYSPERKRERERETEGGVGRGTTIRSQSALLLASREIRYERIFSRVIMKSLSLSLSLSLSPSFALQLPLLCDATVFFVILARSFIRRYSQIRDEFSRGLPARIPPSLLPPSPDSATIVADANLMTPFSDTIMPDTRRERALAKRTRADQPRFHPHQTFSVTFGVAATRTSPEVHLNARGELAAS